MDGADFEQSAARARKAQSRSRTVGLVTKDFMWITGRWRWWPESTTMPTRIWNPEGGAALFGFHRRTYWLCLGWSRIEVVPHDDPRDTIQHGQGGHDGGA
jgi:hypothetical protein